MKEEITMKYDFSGYATKAMIRCADGRTILPNAFAEQDGAKVPLVWQHNHKDPNGVLGHAYLENRPDGVYCYGVLNDTPYGLQAKNLLQHGDIDSMSIFANDLVQNGSGHVSHGTIREVSLVMAGANPGAMIDNVVIEHGINMGQPILTEAVIYSGEEFTDINGDFEPSVLSHAAPTGQPPIPAQKQTTKDDNSSDKTVQDVIDSMTEEQKNVLYFLVGSAAEEKQEEMKHSYMEEMETMKKNLFEAQGLNVQSAGLTQEQKDIIMHDAMEMGSFKNAVLAHAAEYGIETIDQLFPEARLSGEPEWLKREDDWVAGVLAGVAKSPFSRIKTLVFDINFDEARAKGYVKSSIKKDTYMKWAKRTTSPTTVYVKQKLDRDDVLDLTEFSAVELVKKEMRILLNEELARAILIGDGRDIDDEYKIKEDCIRPIWTDNDLYVTKENLKAPAAGEELNYALAIETIAKSGKHYKGSGSPTFFTTNAIHMNMLWVKDQNGRRIYENDSNLCAALGVSKIVEVDAMDDLVRVDNSGVRHQLVGIKVNLKDYKVGTDKGGDITSFEDFDIDYNQYKYLMETRCSGCMVKPRGAQVYEYNLPAGQSTNGQ